MADNIQILDTYHVLVGDKPGEGRRLLEHISERGINLQTFTAFPVADGTTRLSFATDRVQKLKEAADDAGLELLGPERAFLVHGEDRIGALHQYHLILANAGVNVFASSCVIDDHGRFGFILWVNPADFDRAAFAFDFI
jgi:hypothetical protein